MVSHKIDLEVMLIPNDSKLKASMDALVSSFQGKLSDAITSGSNSRLKKTITEKTPNKKNEIRNIFFDSDKDNKDEKTLSVDKEDKKRDTILSSLLNVAKLTLGVTTGIIGILSRVPSILQASLKLMGIGFLLILKPLADLLGMILMPIGIAMIKLAAFLMKYSGGAGFGGLVGMILGGILAVIIGASLGAPTIALGLIILFGIIAGAVLGSIVGAASEWAWEGLIEIEKSILNSILTSVDNWIGLPEEGFWGGIFTALKEWVSKDNTTSFWDLITGSVQDWIDEKYPSLSTAVEKGFDLTEQLGGILKYVRPDGLLKLSKDFSPLSPYKAAKGGIFNSPTNAIIGEAGPEAVIPLDKLNTMSSISINVNGIFEENRLRDIMRVVAEDVMHQHKQVSGSVF